QALVLNGTDAAAQILLQALTTSSGRPRAALVAALSPWQAERAAPLFCYLVRHLDRKTFPAVCLGAIDALGSFGGPDAVEALKEALHRGDWLPPERAPPPPAAPRRARVRPLRTRAAAAQALRRIGNTAAVAALRESSSRGPRGVRSAAKAELKKLG